MRIRRHRLIGRSRHTHVAIARRERYEDLARCIAPIDGRIALCGARATQDRIVEGLACPLCRAHAAELDTHG